jgi:hypothetical protein
MMALILASMLFIGLGAQMACVAKECIPDAVGADVKTARQAIVLGVMIMAAGPLAMVLFFVSFFA